MLEITSFCIYFVIPMPVSLCAAKPPQRSGVPCTDCGGKELAWEWIFIMTPPQQNIACISVLVQVYLSANDTSAADYYYTAQYRSMTEFIGNRGGRCTVMLYMCFRFRCVLQVLVMNSYFIWGDTDRSLFFLMRILEYSGMTIQRVNCKGLIINAHGVNFCTHWRRWH